MQHYRDQSTTRFTASCPMRIKLNTPAYPKKNKKLNTPGPHINDSTSTIVFF